MSAYLALLLCLVIGLVVIVGGSIRNHRAKDGFESLREWEAWREAMRRTDEGSVAAALPWVAMLAFVLLMSAVGAIEGAGY